MVGKKYVFLMITPDGVSRGLVGTCLQRFERRGFRVEALKAVTLTGMQVKQLYAKVTNEKFFTDLSMFMQSGPCVAMLLTHEHLEDPITEARYMIGAVYPRQPGSIRADFAESERRNVIHVTDDPLRVLKEAALIMGAP